MCPIVMIVKRKVLGSLLSGPVASFLRKNMLMLNWRSHANKEKEEGRVRGWRCYHQSALSKMHALRLVPSLLYCPTHNNVPRMHARDGCSRFARERLLLLLLRQPTSDYQGNFPRGFFLRRTFSIRQNHSYIKHQVYTGSTWKYRATEH